MVSLIAKIVFAISSLAFLVPNVWVMVTCRFFMGIAQGLLMSCSNGTLYQASLPEHRSKFIPLLSVSFAVGFCLVSVVGLFDNGTVIWRSLFLFIGFMALLDVLNMVFVLRKTDLVTYLLKFKG
jgi:putative MFS transporter